MLGKLYPDPPDDRRLCRLEHERAGMDEVPRSVAQAPIAEWVVPAVATVLEELALHPGHPFRVEITLELVGQTELAEHVATRRPISAPAQPLAGIAGTGSRASSR